MKMNVEGKRGRGRPIKSWWDTIEYDMRTVGVCIGEVKNREKWSDQPLRVGRTSRAKKNNNT